MLVWLVEGSRRLVTRITEVIVMTGRKRTTSVVGAVLRTGRSNPTAMVGGVLAFIGAVLVLGGMGPIGEYRDADGYYMSDLLAVDRPHHAVISTDTDLLRGRYETLTESSLALAFADDPVDVRMQGVASGPSALFLGIAPTSAVDDYLEGVAYDEITDWGSNLAAMTDIVYTTHQGTALPGPPGAETFWETSVAGTGSQTLDWAIEPGEWTAVIMNAEASPEITADLAFGAAPSFNLEVFAWTSLGVGAIVLLGGVALMYLGLRHHRASVPRGLEAGDEALTAQNEATVAGSARKS